MRGRSGSCAKFRIKYLEYSVTLGILYERSNKRLYFPLEVGGLYEESYKSYRLSKLIIEIKCSNTI